jgi:hypothetical protein
MIVGVLIIAWVVVLRIMYQKKVMEDRHKAGLVTPGPARDSWQRSPTSWLELRTITSS